MKYYAIKCGENQYLGFQFIGTNKEKPYIQEAPYGIYYYISRKAAESILEIYRDKSPLNECTQKEVVSITF